jgi:hypothetical protein
MKKSSNAQITNLKGWINERSLFARNTIVGYGSCRNPDYRYNRYNSRNKDGGYTVGLYGGIWAAAGCGCFDIAVLQKI